MPFHINGRFELSPNRREIIVNERNDRKRTDWNHDLLTELFPSVYVQFLLEMRNRLELHEYYKLFPTKMFLRNDIGKISTNSLLEEMKKSEVIFVVPNNEWSKIHHSSQVLQLVQQHQTYLWMLRILVYSKLKFGWIPDETFNMMKLNDKNGMNIDFFLTVLERCNQQESLFTKDLKRIWKSLDSLLRGSRHEETHYTSRIAKLNLVPVIHQRTRSLKPTQGYYFVKSKRRIGNEVFSYFSRFLSLRALDITVFNELPKFAQRIILEKNEVDFPGILDLLKSYHSSLPKPTIRERNEIFRKLESQPNWLLKSKVNVIQGLPVFENIHEDKFCIIYSKSNASFYVECHLPLRTQKNLRDSVRRNINGSFEIYSSDSQSNLYSCLQIEKLTIESIFTKIIFATSKSFFFDSFSDGDKEEFMCLLLKTTSWYSNTFVSDNPEMKKLRCVYTTKGWKTFKEAIDGAKYMKFLGRSGNYVKGKMKKNIKELRGIEDFQKLEDDAFLKIFKNVCKDAKLSLLWMKHLEKCLNLFEVQIKKCLESIKKLLFLPVKKKRVILLENEEEEYDDDEELICSCCVNPDLVHPRYADICSSKCLVIHNNVFDECSKLSKMLNLLDRKPTSRMVYLHLLAISEQFERSSEENKVKMNEIMHTVLHKIYRYLNRDQNQKPKYLIPNAKWLWTGNGFSPTETTSFYRKSENRMLNNTYLNYIRKEYVGYRKLFVLFGVKEYFSLDDLLDVYNDHLCSKISVGEIIKDRSDLRTMIGITIEIYSLLRELKIDPKSPCPEMKNLKKKLTLLPSNEGKLERLEKLWVDDIPFVKDTQLLYVKEGVPKELCSEFLEVKSKVRNLLKIEESKVSVWTENDVKVDITKFLRNFLEDNPEGDGLFSEILQNADDAGATTTCIMYDENEYPSEQVPPWYKGRGQSVLIFNDGKFSDDDFRGIQKPLNSSKRFDCSKTGKFGQGVCVLFHIGNTFELISGDRFCIMDPFEEKFTTINFLGTQYTSEFEDLFVKPFEHFEGGIDYSKEYPFTMFRIPVRSEGNEIKDSTFGMRNFLDIVKSFQSNKKAESHLMFLKNVSKFSIKILRKGETEPETILKVVKTGGKKYSEKHKRMIRVKKLGNDFSSLKMENPLIDRVIVTVMEKKKRLRTYDWIVSYFCSTDPEMMKEKKKISLGGVACLLEKKDHHVDDRFIEGRIFNTLMTKQRTGLPVHINGDFEIVHSRARLMSGTDCTGGDERKRYLWNVRFFKYIIFPCFGRLFDHIVRELGPEYISLLYSMFPDPEQDLKYEEEEEEEELEVDRVNISSFFLESEKILKKSSKDEFMKMLHVQLFDYVMANKFFLTSDGKFKRIENTRKFSSKSISPDIKNFLLRTGYPNQITGDYKKINLRNCYRDQILLFGEQDLVNHLKEIQPKTIGNNEDNSLCDYNEKFIESSVEFSKLFEFMIAHNKVKPEELNGLFILPVDSGHLMKYEEGEMDLVFKDRNGIIHDECLKHRFIDKKFSKKKNQIMEFFKRMGVVKLGLYHLHIFKRFLQDDKDYESFRIVVKKVWEFFDRQSTIIKKDLKRFLEYFGYWMLIPIRTKKEEEFEWVKISEKDKCLLPILEKKDYFFFEYEKKKVNMNQIAGVLRIPLIELFSERWGVEKEFKITLRLREYNAHNFLQLIGSRIDEVNELLDDEMRLLVLNFVSSDAEELTRSDIDILKKLRIFELHSGGFVTLDGDQWKIVPKKCPAVLHGNYLRWWRWRKESAYDILRLTFLSPKEILKYFSDHGAQEFHKIEKLEDQVILMKYIFESLGKEELKEQSQYNRYYKPRNPPFEELEDWKFILNNEGKAISVGDCIVTNNKVVLEVFKDHPNIIPQKYLEMKGHVDFMKLLDSHFGIKVWKVYGDLFVRTVKYLLKKLNNLQKNELFRLCEKLNDIFVLNWNTYLRNSNQFREICHLGFVPCTMGYDEEVLSSFRECCHPDEELLVRGLKAVLKKEIVKKLSLDLIEKVKLFKPDFETVKLRLEIVKLKHKEEEVHQDFLKKMNPEEIEKTLGMIYDFFTELYKKDNENNSKISHEQLEQLKRTKCIYIHDITPNQDGVKQPDPNVRFALPKETYFNNPFKSSLADSFWKVCEEYKKYLPLFKFLGTSENLPDSSKNDEILRDLTSFISTIYGIPVGSVGSFVSNAPRPRSSKEAKLWIIQASEMLKGAKVMFEVESYGLCCFLCQQSVEMALKAVCHNIGKFTNQDEKTHYYLNYKVTEELRKRISNSMSQMGNSFDLYITTRYVKGGKLPSERYGKFEADVKLKAASDVINGCKNELSF